MTAKAAMGKAAIMRVNLHEQAYEAISRLRIARSDLKTVEAKAAREGLPHSVRESVSAFANTAGGLLLLGLDELTYRPLEVDAPKLAEDLASACAYDLEPPIQPDIGIVNVGGRRVVAALVSELPSGRKPCFLNRRGVSCGSYIRTHSGDRRLTPYEVHILVSGRTQPRDDVVVVEGASRRHLAPELVESLLSRVRSHRGRIVADSSDEEILSMMNVLIGGDPERVSLAGLMALGRYPQQFFPQLNVHFMAFATPSGDPLEDGSRFLDNESIDGPIPLMVARTQAAVLRNMTRRTVVTESGRFDQWDYPEEVIRELVVNALEHRDYHPLAHGWEVWVKMYPDRLEVTSPGGLHGPMDRRRLMSDPVTSSRNPYLAKLLEDVQVPTTSRSVCESRGSGLISIAASLRRCGLMPLHLMDRIDRFTAVVRSKRCSAQESNELWAPRSRVGANHNSRRGDRRTAIVELLAVGPRSSRELAGELGMTPQGILRWLRRMEASGEVWPTEVSRRSPRNRWQLADR